MSLTQKRVLVFASLLGGIPLVAFAIIKLASGYRPDFASKSLRPTGLLVATSLPDGAQIYLDEKLKSATNDTLNLAPGEYQVVIKKDGFTSWQKTLQIKKEVVTQTNAFLFATFPNLKALTFTGAAQPLLSPDGQRVAFSVATASASNQGLWVLDLAERPLGLTREPRQILRSASGGRDFSQAEYRWSPDSKQLLVTLEKENFLAEALQFNPATTLIDITANLTSLNERWQEEEELRREAQISKLPKELLEIIENSTKDLIFAPDETKILYTATASAQIPEKIIQPLPAASTQPETRQLAPNQTYVYDLKEDRNFLITEAGDLPLTWFPTSQHLFLVSDDKIRIGEYDNTNWVDVYSGPFVNTFAFPYPSADKILVLTNLGPETPANLYAISLR